MHFLQLKLEQKVGELRFSILHSGLNRITYLQMYPCIIKEFHLCIIFIFQIYFFNVMFSAVQLLIR